MWIYLLFIWKKTIWCSCLCRQHEAQHLNIIHKINVLGSHPSSGNFIVFPTSCSSTAFWEYLPWNWVFSNHQHFQSALKTLSKDLLFVCRSYCVRNVVACNTTLTFFFWKWGGPWSPRHWNNILKKRKYRLEFCFDGISAFQYTVSRLLRMRFESLEVC